MESRCGILCSQCEYKDRMNCLGCINIAHPFWNDVCPIKQCVEEKQLSHCGECEQFPCALAKQFAYDEKQGDQGKRLCQCQRWKEEVKG